MPFLGDVSGLSPTGFYFQGTSTLGKGTLVFPFSRLPSGCHAPKATVSGGDRWPRGVAASDVSGSEPSCAGGCHLALYESPWHSRVLIAFQVRPQGVPMAVQGCCFLNNPPAAATDTRRLIVFGGKLAARFPKFRPAEAPRSLRRSAVGDFREAES